MNSIVNVSKVLFVSTSGLLSQKSRIYVIEESLWLEMFSLTWFILQKRVFLEQWWLGQERRKWVVVSISWPQVHIGIQSPEICVWVCDYLNDLVEYKWLIPRHNLVSDLNGGRGGACGPSNYRNPLRKFAKFPFTEPIQWKTPSPAKLQASASALYWFHICKKITWQFKILAILYFYCSIIIFKRTLQQVLLLIELN